VACGAVTRIIGRYDAINANTENQKLPMLAGLSLVRSGCWLIAPEMARKSPGHAKNLFRVTMMRPDNIILDEPNISGSSRFQDFGKVTLVSRDASLGSLGLDMMAVRSNVCAH